MARLHAGGGKGRAWGNAFAQRADGGVAVAGALLDRVRYREVETMGLGGEDALLWEIDPTGAPTRTAVHGGAAWDRAEAIAALPGGDLLLAGVFERIAAIGGHRLRSAGERDGWVARIGPEGVRWATAIGGPGGDVVQSLAVRGRVALVGMYRELGGGAWTATHAVDIDAGTASEVLGPGGPAVVATAAGFVGLHTDHHKGIVPTPPRGDRRRRRRRPAPRLRPRRHPAVGRATPDHLSARRRTLDPGDPPRPRRHHRRGVAMIFWISLALAAGPRTVHRDPSCERFAAGLVAGEVRGEEVAPVPLPPSRGALVAETKLAVRAGTLYVAAADEVHVVSLDPVPAWLSRFSEGRSGSMVVHGDLLVVAASPNKGAQDGLAIYRLEDPRAPALVRKIAGQPRVMWREGSALRWVLWLPHPLDRDREGLREVERPDPRVTALVQAGLEEGVHLGELSWRCADQWAVSDQLPHSGLVTLDLAAPDGPLHTALVPDLDSDALAPVHGGVVAISGDATVDRWAMPHDGPPAWAGAVAPGPIDAERGWWVEAAGDGERTAHWIGSTVVLGDRTLAAAAIPEGPHALAVIGDGALLAGNSRYGEAKLQWIPAAGEPSTHPLPGDPYSAVPLADGSALLLLEGHPQGAAVRLAPGQAEPSARVDLVLRSTLPQTALPQHEGRVAIPAGGGVVVLDTRRGPEVAFEAPLTPIETLVCARKLPDQACDTRDPESLRRVLFNNHVPTHLHGLLFLDDGRLVVATTDGVAVWTRAGALVGAVLFGPP